MRDIHVATCKGIIAKLFLCANAYLLAIYWILEHSVTTAVFQIWSPHGIYPLSYAKNQKWYSAWA